MYIVPASSSCSLFDWWSIPFPCSICYSTVYSTRLERPLFIYMTALCQFVMTTEENIVPAFEGIDPPLLDPQMVEHFNNLQTPEPAKNSEKINGNLTLSSSEEKGAINLQNLSLDDLVKLVTQLCETDPSFSEQILSALNGDTSGDDKDKTALNETPASEPMIVSEAEPPLPDTNTLLKTLNQSFLLQEYNNTLAFQIAQANTRLGGSLDATNSTTSSVLLNAESLEAMKSNLFVMENKGNNFVPLKEFRRPGPKYTRKNFSPEQIEGLEAAFQEHRFVKKDLRKELAKKLNLSERSISYWFQNKRARSKPPITMSSEAALKAAQQQQELEKQQQEQNQQESLVAALQQTIQQSCAT